MSIREESTGFLFNSIELLLTDYHVAAPCGEAVSVVSDLGFWPSVSRTLRAVSIAAFGTPARAATFKACDLLFTPGLKWCMNENDPPGPSAMSVQ